MFPAVSPVRRDKRQNLYFSTVKLVQQVNCLLEDGACVCCSLDLCCKARERQNLYVSTSKERKFEIKKGRRAQDSMVLA